MDIKVYRIRLNSLKKYPLILLVRAWTRKSLSAGFFCKMLSFKLKFALSDICFIRHIIIHPNICRSFHILSFFNNTATALKHRGSFFFGSVCIEEIQRRNVKCFQIFMTL